MMGVLLGTAGIAAVMVQATKLFVLLSNTVLEASVWIFAAALFPLVYFVLLPTNAYYLNPEEK